MLYKIYILYYTVRQISLHSYRSLTSTIFCRVTLNLSQLMTLTAYKLVATQFKQFVMVVCNSEFFFKRRKMHLRIIGVLVCPPVCGASIRLPT